MKTTVAVVIVVAAIGAGSAAAGQTDVRAKSDAPFVDIGSIAGTWTLNKDLSDSPEARMPARDGQRPAGGGFGRGGRGGGRGGGFGGGFPGGGRPPRDDVARRQEALRDLLEAPERLTIVNTGSMIVVTTQDGRTTRLSPDGSRIKNESTGAERKTTWQAGKLVSEISGNGPKVIETYSADLSHRELLVIVQIDDAGRDQPRRVLHRLYQADAR